ncbi:MAG TPA: hypothetical protein VFP68_20675 [Burkholderiaceae bacterium]|nr:hypothetical protein [Burkholderiaceae bacterium]
MPRSDVFQTFRDLHSLKATCTTLRDVISTDPQLGYADLRQRIDHANQIVQETPDEQVTRSMNGLARILPLLSPRHRERLVHLASTMRDGSAMGQLSRQIAYLDRGQRNRLVKAAIAIVGQSGWADALAGLGEAMTQLDEKQRKGLIAHVIGIDNDDRAKATGIGHLARGFASFEPEDRRRLVETAVIIDDQLCRAYAISRIADQMAHLNATERTLSVECTFQMDDVDARACALSALANAMDHLDAAQHEQIFEGITNIANEWAAAGALKALCRRLAHLNGSQRQTILDRVIAMGDEGNQGEALSGVDMAALDSPQRDRVIAAVERMADAEARSGALAGLIGEAKHLSLAQRERLVAASIALDDFSRSDVLGFVPIAHLSAPQVDRLIAAAAEINHEEGRGKALSNLASQTPDLSSAQVDLLLEAISHISNENQKADALGSMVKHGVHLNQTQVDRIFAITNEFQFQRARIEVMSNFLARERPVPGA